MTDDDPKKRDLEDGNPSKVEEGSTASLSKCLCCMVCLIFGLVVAYYPLRGDPWPWTRTLRKQPWGNVTLGTGPWSSGKDIFGLMQNRSWVSWGNFSFANGGKPMLESLENPSSWGITKSGESLMGILQNHSRGVNGSAASHATSELFIGHSNRSNRSALGPPAKWKHPPWEVWGGSSEDFPLLGNGLCLRESWTGAELIPKYNTWVSHTDVMQSFFPADHDTCERDCRNKPWCTGFVTFGYGQNSQSCSLIWKDEGLPFSHDWNPAFKCYWRKKWRWNSVGIYTPPLTPVPKIIWTYWENLKKTDWGHRPEATSASFLDLCHRSWRRLNPDWKVHILNQFTVWDYISKDDLPKGFDNLMIQHKSDSIRLALIVKYGGVWIDATILLLKPLDSVIKESEPEKRHFYVNRGTKNKPTIKTRYARYNTEFHVENWFIAAPPQDPFILRTNNCVKELHKFTDKKRFEDFPYLFTPRQISDLNGLGLWEYVATSACFFKVLDDDREIARWWLSPSVRRQNLMGHLNEAWFGYGNAHGVMVDLFYRYQDYVVKDLAQDSLLLLKFTHDSRKALIDPVTPLQIYGCDYTSWGETLKAIGVNTSAKCTEMRKVHWWG